VPFEVNTWHEAEHGPDKGGPVLSSESLLTAVLVQLAVQATRAEQPHRHSL
jgi:hypothetical protein